MHVVEQSHFIFTCAKTGFLMMQLILNLIKNIRQTIKCKYYLHSNSII